MLALVSALLGLLGQLAWRAAVPKGSGLDAVSLVRLLLDWRTLLGFALYGLSTLAWLAALSYDELSKLYPLTVLAAPRRYPALCAGLSGFFLRFFPRSMTPLGVGVKLSTLTRSGTLPPAFFKIFRMALMLLCTTWP